MTATRTSPTFQHIMPIERSRDALEAERRGFDVPSHSEEDFPFAVMGPVSVLASDGLWATIQFPNASTALVRTHTVVTVWGEDQ